MSVWRLEQRIGRQLFGWGIINVALGTLLLLSDSPLLRGLGVQAIVWGSINAGIAALGQSRLPGKLHRMLRSGGLEATATERRSLRRLLLINAGLDLGYIVAGLLVVALLPGPFAAGNGWGIVLQGGALLLFDAVHGGYSIGVLDD
jgi:hypothetical protein